ncbi:MAG: TAT-variant-translocated molybdopterin oxidoreductase [Verrucomicrobiota bacterium]
MKRKWKHPEEPETSRQYWRSLGELEDSEEFRGWLEREFPQGAAELEMDETSRRNFVKLMGASTALAGFGVACSRPVAHIVPYNQHVEWIIPGKALYYSTVKPRLGGLGCIPLVATTYEGRPTKVDGNRLHPDTGASTSAFTQASILELYDQDRSKGFLAGGKEVTAEDFNASFFAAFREAKSGAKTAMLLSPSTSPTRNGLLKEITKSYPEISFYSYEALEGEGATAARSELYGKNVLPVVKMSNVERVLSLDCDFLGYETIGDDCQCEFSATRDVESNDEISRFYAVESAFTLTGGLADHRYRIAPSQILPVAALLAKKVAEKTGDSGLASLAEEAVSQVVVPVYDEEWISECAIDLAEHVGGSIVVAGSRQSREVHILVSAINKALGAYGKFITLVQHELPEYGTLPELAESIKDGEVENLFVLSAGDVAYDAPVDLDFSTLLDTVPNLIHLGYTVNETAKRATWHIPGTHYLESWSDHYSLGGVYSVQQPMINPLWGGTSENVFLLSFLSEEPSEEAVLEQVKLSFARGGYKDWNQALRDGYAKGKRLPRKKEIADPASLGGLKDLEIADLPHEEGLELNLTVSGATYDGRFVNNGWLQEAPDPITKLTWDNAALISQLTARTFKIEDEDFVTLTVGDREIEVPVLVSPGHADFVLSLPLGYYGDLAEGTVSRGVGFNAYPMMTSEERYIVPGVTLVPTGRKHQLALTAEHYSMEGRAIARMGTTEMLEEDPSFAQYQGMDHHIPENISLYKGPDYQNAENPGGPGGPGFNALPGHEFKPDPNHQWAMTVDLNSCTGCNACVISCQAENNIPIVGKDQVLEGREMHWLRMDRYFTSPKDKETVSERGGVGAYITGAEGTEEEPGRRRVDDDEIEMIPIGVSCMQCESAPCETVCPVNATVHTADGLNAMAYNRCIGTRYCANNCPYKARRFNYYDYNKRPLEKIKIAGIEAEGYKFGPLAPASGSATTTQRLQKNPNVTVRMRGVIEKCTYCVQRLSAAKAAAKAAAGDSPDVMVKTHSVSVACQDACGANAITFGNLMDPKDKINVAKSNGRNYELLKYIGTRPRTSYLARIKNPNPKMPGAEMVGTVTARMH